jgi:CRP-like cAMP-binding protein
MRKREVPVQTTHSPDELYGLLCRASEPVGYATDQVIFEQGELGDKMYLVRHGSVALKDGNRVVEKVGVPGLFGELALIDGVPRALTAVADTDVELVPIGMRQFWVLVHEAPGFACLVMRAIARRLPSLRRTDTTTQT